MVWDEMIHNDLKRLGIGGVLSDMYIYNHILVSFTFDLCNVSEKKIV